MTKNGKKTDDQGIEQPYNPADKGYYYDNDNRTCTPCPDYTYASTATPISDSNKAEDTLYNCIPNSGYYSTTGITTTQGDEIFSCPSNMYSDTDTRVPGTIEKCIGPDENNLCSENEFCQTCPLRQGINSHSGYDFISDNEGTNCRNCNNGTGNLGEYRDSDGTCQTCEAGTKCSGGVSTGCLAGYYIPTNIPDSGGALNNNNQCYPCASGSYCLETDNVASSGASPCPVGTTSDEGTSIENLCYLEDGKYFTYTAGNPPAYATEQCPGSGPGTPDGEGAVAPSRQTLANFKAFIQEGKSGFNSYHKTTDCLYNACPGDQHRDFSGSCVPTTTTASPPCTNAQVPISNRYQHGTDIVEPLSWPENTGTGTLYTQPDIQPIYEKYYHQLESANFAPDDAPAIPNDLRLFGNHYRCVDASYICTDANTYLVPIS
jgi:hypothetical protein